MRRRYMNRGVQAGERVGENVVYLEREYMVEKSG